MTNPMPTLEDAKRYMSKLPVFKGWPVDCIQDKSWLWEQQSYRLQQLVVSDSNRTEWLYIITSGSVDVIKKMKNVPPTHLPQLASAWDDEHLVPRRWRKKSGSGHKRAILRRVVTPCPVKYNHLPDMLMKLEERIPGVLKPKERLGIIDYDQIMETHKRRIVRNAPTPGSMFGGDSEISTDMPDVETRVRRMSLYQGIRKTTKGVYMSTTTVKEVQEDYQKEMKITKKFTPKRESSPTPSYLPSFLPPIEHDHSKLMALVKRKKRKRKAGRGSPSSSNRAVFVFMQTLEKGDVFGLHEIAYPDQTSLTVVSNGCECLKINKSLFRDHADMSYMVQLQSMIRPYPDEPVILSNYQQAVNVRHHLHQTYIDQLTGRVDNRRIKQSQFPQHAGLYNFRTGPL